VLLDCDIGKNSCLEGCISLTSGNTSKKIWIGEFTPLNNLQTYLRAVRFLFTYYREHLFTKKLVVNTMGYISGLG
jgi:polynucleotide 5'-kinase involved in rRNA processing